MKRITAIFVFIWIIGLISSSVIWDSLIPSVNIQMKHIYFDSWNNGYVSLKGTWTIKNEKIYNPIHVSEIKCLHSDGLCYEAKAEFNKSANYISVITDTYKITHWDKNFIIFANDAPVCTKYIYTIDRALKKLSGARIARENVSGCDGYNKENLELSLEDGFSVYWELRQEFVNTNIKYWYIGMLLWTLLIFFQYRTVKKFKTV